VTIVITPNDILTALCLGFVILFIGFASWKSDRDAAKRRNKGST